ncbi:unnamed protein product [Cunninghamella blakesleeana]
MKLTKRIENFEEVDICYENDPKKPVLVHYKKHLFDPFTYKKYLYTQENIQEELKTKLNSEVQIIKFLNEVYTVTPQNESIYELKLINVEEVHSAVNQYIDLMKQKSAVVFANWCEKKIIQLMTAPLTRKQRKTDKQTIVKAIHKYMSHYQMYINNLKADGYYIVGYCRKSIGKESDEKRIDLNTGFLGSFS